MKKLEIYASNVENAKSQAYKKGIIVIFDATKAWIGAKCPILPEDLKIFAAEFMVKKNMMTYEGAGIVICIQQSKTDKEEICKIRNIPRVPRKWKSLVEIIDKDSNKIITTAPNKNKAILKAKQIVERDKRNVYAVRKYIPSEIDFEIEYVPQSKELLGKYVVFGVEDEDVRLGIRRLREFED